MDETLKIWIIMAIFIGLLCICGWMWNFAERKPNSSVAFLIYSILFSIITFFALSFSLMFLDGISQDWYKNSSWIAKLIICGCIGLYLTFKYEAKLEKRAHNKKIVKVVVYWGINDNKKPSEYYTKEIIPANGDEFSTIEFDAINKDMLILRNLKMLGYGTKTASEC